MACMMIEKYTSPTRRVNIAKPMMKASKIGMMMMANKVNPKLWKGSQKPGKLVIWFQSIKSGIPGVVCAAVDCMSEASSFRNMAMQ
nr:hypothetical protein NRS6118_04422 [Bacillus subtilis]